MNEEVSWTDPKTWEVIHEHKKKIDLKSDFFADTTGMSYYDGLLEFPEYHKENKGECGVIIDISPDHYLRACSIIRSKPSSVEDEMMAINKDRIEKYYHRSLKGEKMPILVLDKHRCSQEGRHRAMTAKKLGLKQIPVLVVEEC